jgi:eukaryotic-like serine/threonine-protein kinase
MACPSREELHQWLREWLAAEAGQRVEAHVERCQECQSELEGLTRDCRQGRPDEKAVPLGAAEMIALLEQNPVSGIPPLLLPPKTPQPWPRIPGYEILGELGQGSMGIVYKARQVKLKRIVALKMILAGKEARAFLVRFQNEAEAVARLQHPNIVRLYEVCQFEGQPFLVMEYVPGGNLLDRFGGTPLPARQAAQLVEVLARAMHHAHQLGIIHRDLKPANILLADEDIPKITDFGLAKFLLKPEAGQTVTGAVMGTASYMAPEQAQGKNKEVSFATDVYALGAILYEELTGRPPFKGSSLLETLALVRSAEVLPPALLQPKVPRNLETICLKCLEKEPGRRYASALALADDLRRFRNNEPIVARPTSLVNRARKWAKRQPVVAALLASVVLITAAGFGLVLHKWQRAEAGWREAIEKAKERPEGR